MASSERVFERRAALKCGAQEFADFSGEYAEALASHQEMKRQQTVLMNHQTCRRPSMETIKVPYSGRAGWFVHHLGGISYAEEGDGVTADDKRDYANKQVIIFTIRFVISTITPHVLLVKCERKLAHEDHDVENGKEPVDRLKKDLAVSEAC